MISYKYFKNLLSELVYDLIYFDVERNAFSCRVYLNGRLLKVFGVRKKDALPAVTKDFSLDSRSRIVSNPELPLNV